MTSRYDMFTVLINRASRNIRRIKTEETVELDLKSPHVSCLYYIYKNAGPMTAKELCDVCDEDKASVSRSIDYLEKNGYIRCDSKTDKRYKSPLSLTEKGFTASEIIVKKIDDIVNIAGAGLSKKNRKIFYESLALISNNLQSFCDKKYKKED